MNSEDRPLLASVETPPPDAWRRRLENEGTALDALVTRLREGVDVQPLYTGAPASAAGWPGVAPFHRGASTEPGAWLLAQEYNQPSVEAARAALLADLERGVELACLGAEVPVRDVDAAAALFEGIGLERLAVLCDNPVTGYALLAAAEQLGVGDLRGGCGWQSLFVETQVEGSDDDNEVVRMGQELIALCRKRFPGMRALSVSTVVHHAIGANAVEELAIAIASGVDLLRLMTGPELDVDAVAEQILFRFAVSDDVFLEIAKLRAARLLWSKVLRGAGATPRPMEIHVRTSPRTRTSRDPWTNLLRGTAECFAAAVGGAVSICNLPFDETLGESGVPELGVAPGTGRRWALGAQHVLREEASLGRVVDPAGGSYYVEELTDGLARRAWELFREIEERGGVRLTDENSWLLERVATSGADLCDAAARRKTLIVGTSAYPDLASTAPAATLEKLDDDFCRPATMFEELHAASEIWLAEIGRRPRAFLACAGDAKDYRPRAAFIADFLAAGGFEAVESEPLSLPEDAVRAFRDADADVAVLCAADRLYPEIAPAFAVPLASAGARAVGLAGRGGDRAETYKDAGVDLFLHRGADAIDVLTYLLKAVGEINGGENE